MIDFTPTLSYILELTRWMDNHTLAIIMHFNLVCH
jgi:hypothetical protein